MYPGCAFDLISNMRYLLETIDIYVMREDELEVTLHFACLQFARLRVLYFAKSLTEIRRSTAPVESCRK